jgi:hypothetical protein
VENVILNVFLLSPNSIVWSPLPSAFASQPPVALWWQAQVVTWLPDSVA